MNLFIRADADVSMGTGHIMRCLAIAQAWQNAGGSAMFISRCPSDGLQQRIRREGFGFTAIQNSYPHANDAEETKALLDAAPGSPPSWTVLDGYHFDLRYQTVIRATGTRLLVIDDMAHQVSYTGDILLNQNLGACRLTYNCETGTRTLLGPEHALIRREFFPYRRQRTPAADARKILISLGGGDFQNVTAAVLKALALIPMTDIQVRVIIGPANSHREQIEHVLSRAGYQNELLTAVDDMGPHMIWADLAVLSGGGTCWEAAYLGLPAVVLATTPHEQQFAADLLEAGMIDRWDSAAQLSGESFSRVVEDLLHNARRREELVRTGQKTVDGHGADRVVTYMRSNTHS